MIAPRPALHEIETFLQRKRFAAIGVSRNPKDFTRTLFAEFRRRGYDVVPVNPGVSAIDDVPCFASVRDISPPVEGALLLTRPEVSDDIADQCIQAGVRQVWMYRAGGTGAVSPRAVVACQLNGIQVIAGECPFMFFSDTAFFHRAHGFCRKLMGRFPR
ncbi:CoA-binding protein [Candidatus Sulfopaludibacter sp. SbA3]|nr:CoA-binding protein [Candidatus Sulfopaludibacter sp. SbA3]